MFMFSWSRKKQKADLPIKLNPMVVFNKEEEYKLRQTNTNLELNRSQKRVANFELVLNAPIVNLEQLKMMAWDGVPECYRSKAWKILLKYLPTNKQTQQATLKRKRNDYFQRVQTYIENPTLERDANDKKIFKLINDDVVRTLPDSTLFRNLRIQAAMRRVLYVWHMRHPASGYVQGINDVVTPFIIVFLNDKVKINLDTLEDVKELDQVSDEELRNIEADSYWCLSKILDGILDNYTSSWPGIQKSYNRLLEILKRVDNELIEHFTQAGFDLNHMYFKWVACLLLRQFSSKVGLRLYDSYLSDDTNYFNLCLYIMAAVLFKYSKKMKKMSFEDMMEFYQKIPTREWKQEDLTIAIAEAYSYQSYFQKK